MWSVSVWLSGWNWESASGFVGWCDRKSAAWNWWKIHFLYETEKEKAGRRYLWLWETKWGRSTCGFSFLLIFKLKNNTNEGLWCDGDAYLYVPKFWSKHSLEIQKKLWKPPRLKTLKKHPPACEHYAHSFPMNSPLRTTSWACCSRVFFSFGFLYVKTESDNRKLQRPEPNLKQRGVWVFSTTKIDSDARLESLRLLRDEEKAISEFEAVSVPPLGRSQPVFRRGIQSTGSRFMSLRSSFGKNEKSVTGKLVEILLQSKTGDLRKKLWGVGTKLSL